MARVGVRLPHAAQLPHSCSDMVACPIAQARAKRPRICRSHHAAPGAARPDAHRKGDRAHLENVARPPRTVRRQGSKPLHCNVMTVRFSRGLAEDGGLRGDDCNSVRCCVGRVGSSPRPALCSLPRAFFDFSVRATFVWCKGCGAACGCLAQPFRARRVCARRNRALPSVGQGKSPQRHAVLHKALQDSCTLHA